mmetsp:Transcript_8176/g.7323  ORF Transcript_8176/g.7323 Transcript_8176/m.7323 type:complete len:109 (+) Transcript_8176:21-347(+)
MDIFDNDNDNNNNENQANIQKLKDLGVKVNECMLSQSVFFVGGLLIGTALGYRLKNYTPLIIGTGVGTGADYAYARLFKCKGLIDNYDKLKESINNPKLPDKNFDYDI